MQEVVAALRFAAAFQEVLAPVARVMKHLQAHQTPSARRCAVACASALVTGLPRLQVGPHLCLLSYVATPRRLFHVMYKSTTMYSLCTHYLRYHINHESARNLARDSGLSR